MPAPYTQLMPYGTPGKRYTFQEAGLGLKKFIELDSLDPNIELDSFLNLRGASSFDEIVVEE